MGSIEIIEHEKILALPEHLNYDPIKEHQTRNGVPVLDKFWVINPKTDQVIGDGKSQHRPTNFNTMWESLRQGLLRSSLDLNNAKTNFWGYNNDASFRAEIVLPNHNFVKQLNEPACLKIKVIDSHDQKFRRQISAMIMRLACLNGMISVAENTSMSQKHTANSMPEVMGAVASAWPKMLTQEAEMMNHMRNVHVSDEAALAFYSEHLATRKTRTGIEVNKARLNYIKVIHDSYQMPDDAYKVYNTLTHLSTHIETQREGACPMTKQLRMETEIQSIIRGDSFKQLARLEDFAVAA